MHVGAAAGASIARHRRARSSVCISHSQFG